jgi:hypothetical protein
MVDYYGTPKQVSGNAERNAEMLSPLKGIRVLSPLKGIRGPAGDLGPVEAFALARFALICASVAKEVDVLSF